MQFYSKTKHIPTINIVSLIDILCILLIFFVVTTEFKEDHPQVEIQLPQSSQAAQSDKADEPVTIYATKDKKIFIDELEIPLEKLVATLKDKQQSALNSVFALKADTDVPLGFFVKVLDASKEAGISNLSLMTEETKK